MSAVDLNTEQVYALYDIENWWQESNDQIYNLSGGPGAGKTFMIRYFIDHIGLDLRNVAFLSYMGKAAMQMARNGLPAQTIHSFIYTYERVLDRDEDGKIQLDQRGKPKMKFQFILKDSLPKDIKLIVVDEASTVPEKMAKDILTFGVPVIALGDLNQLPPVFGNPYFLVKPNFILTQIMRQHEGNPIIWLSQQILNDEPLQYGVYGKSSVISKKDLNEFMLKKADVVLTHTNALRYQFNNLFREQIYKFRKLEIPKVGEKIICRRNNWSRSIQESIFLTNGMSGTIDYIDMESFNGKQLKIDFKPDFLNKRFRNIALDYERLYANPKDVQEISTDLFSYTRDQFEFGYAITTHLSQGSQYPGVIFLDEHSGFSDDIKKKIRYTAVTRAIDWVTIVI